VIAAAALVAPEVAVAWGAHGHMIAAKAAALALPEEMPAFFREAADQLAYLNPEPDRWRTDTEARTDPALRDGFNADHFIRIESVPATALSAPNRFAYLAELRAAGVEVPESVGVAPFRILELFQRLRAEFRLWRQAPDEKTRRWIEQRIINDAGVLGHYVTDVANPLHTTMHHHGWMGDNPGGYATDREVHSRFEGRYVQARFVHADIASLVAPTPSVLEDPRRAILQHVRASHDRVETLYQIDKRSRFDENTTAEENRSFTAERLASGATMLRDLWWTAWVTSASPETPEGHAGRSLRAHRWPTSSPEAEGLASTPLAEVLRELDAGDLPVHSLLIIRHGVLVVEAYFHPFREGSIHNLASTTKSVTSTLLGIAIDEGRIGSVQDRVLSYFPDRTIANRDAYKEGMTIENVLQMRAGLDCEAEEELIKSGADPLQVALDLPMVAKPGTEFCYNNAASHVLAGVVEAATGMSVLDYARSRLLGPIGIGFATWPPVGGGQHWGGGGLFMAPRDVARLGQLFLQNGKWRDRSIVSEEWIAAAVTPGSSLVGRGPLDGYGYQWWTASSGFYSTRGHGGQLVTVIPGLDLVTVLTAAASDAQVLAMSELVSSAITQAAQSDPLPEDPAAFAELKEAIAEAAEAEDGDLLEVQRLPDVALRISGHSISLPDQPGSPSAVTLTFTEGAATANVTAILPPPQDDTFELVVGLDGRWRDFIGPHGLVGRARGGWVSHDTFRLEIDTVANILRATLDMTFDDEDGVEIVARDLTRKGQTRMRGTVLPR